jgi:hypothetical protein
MGGLSFLFSEEKRRSTQKRELRPYWPTIISALVTISTIFGIAEQKKRHAIPKGNG